MWPRNDLTDRLGLEWPIFQAPMDRVATPALAAAVGRAGGLGGIGMWGLDSNAARERIDDVRARGGRGLNVSYPLWPHTGDPFRTGAGARRAITAEWESKGLGSRPRPSASIGALPAEHIEVLASARPDVVSFHFGIENRAVVAELKAAGITVVASATTVEEARLVELAGADVVIAQGLEAGGHRGTFTGVDASGQAGLFSLLPQIVDAVELPVVAAGGIAEGRSIAAAFMLGASAVQIGSAFLRCPEANVPEAYRQVVAEATDTSTRISHKQSGRPARMIRNRLFDVLEEVEGAPQPFPTQLDLTDPLEDAGDADAMLLFAGQSACLARSLPAADLIAALAQETTERLAQGSPIRRGSISPTSPPE